MATVLRLRRPVKPIPAATATPRPRRVKPSVTLTDIPQCISARTAGGIIRRAAFVAVFVTVSEHGAADILDTSKRRVLRMIRRRERVWISEAFGTVIIGRPEPI